MFRIISRGSTKRTESYLRRLTHLDIRKVLEQSGKAGVTALSSATPRETSLAANSWSYEIETSDTGAKITWHNTDIETGFPVALMLQYGYATGTGGYVQGRDYINPAIEPIFKQIAANVAKAVSS